MSFLTNALPSLATFTGAEETVLDTNLASGANPSQVKLALYKLALLMTTMMSQLAAGKTMVAGSIYYSGFGIGSQTSFDPDAALPATTQSTESVTITGVNVLVGGTGGTDNWYVALYNSAGVLMAKSAATLAGTALTIQQIPFTAAVVVPSGDYFIALQSNGTTATFGAMNSPIWPKITGSQTGVAGTLAAITPPTTYTANLGPMASLY
jgi:hypothetical protein